MKPFTLYPGTSELKKCLFRKVFVCLGLLFVLLTSQANCATYQADSGEPRKLTEQETWILEQIRRGNEADLKKRVAGEKDNYSLDAGFLKTLFNSGFKNIQVSNRGVNIANAIIEGDVDLNNVEINYPVYLTHCTFKGQVTSKRSYFGKDLSFEGSEFLKSVNFSGIKIDGNFICDKAHFEDECYWWDAKIGLEFQAVGAEFRSREAPVDFNSMVVGDNAHFRCLFCGPTSFRRVRIGKLFDAKEAKFLNREAPVNRYDIKAGVTFYGMKANHAYFIKTEFHGPVDFHMMEIVESFFASGAKFLKEDETINFTYIKVGQKVFMDETFIQGNLDFSFGSFNDLEIDGKRNDQKDKPEIKASIPCLKLKGANVQRDLNIGNLCIAEFNAREIQVKGHTTIQNTQITKMADFRGANFQALNFEKVQWPKKKWIKGENKRFRYEVYLGDLTFGSLSIDKPECDANGNPWDSKYKNADFDKITNFVDACPFYTQSYVQVETFFKRIGRDSWANDVFIRMNNRELAEKREWYDPIRWLEWFFWGKIAGYGRAPFRVFFLALAFIILGAFLFDPQYLIENKRPSKENVYRTVAARLILSLDRFLPIELGLAKHWESGADNFITWFYFYLQQIIGWILIPIALASIYSQLK